MGIVAVFFVLASLILGLSLVWSETDEGSEVVHASFTTHAPIIIMRDTDFTNASGVVWGSGTADDPYIISGWDIDTETMDACIFVFRTTVHFTIRDCHLHMRGAVCLEIEEAPHGDIIDCLIDEGDYGIFVTKSPDANVKGNTVANMDSLGILVSTSSWVNLSGNDAINDNNTGIGCYRVSNITVENNMAWNGNNTGISIGNATDAYIVGNNASGNGVMGVKIDDARNLVFQGNNITSNLGCGLWVSNSTNLTIFHNNFISNAPNAYQESSSMIRWNETYPIGGNHWSDYSGVDLLGGPAQDEPWSDGFGDTPYQVAVGFSDSYPLVGEASGPFIPEFGAVLVPISLTMAVLWTYSRLRERTAG